jgi:hypothetical protein
MKAEQFMSSTDTPPTAKPTTAALQPIDRTEPETVEGGLVGALLYMAYLIYKYGFVLPQV